MTSPLWSILNMTPRTIQLTLKIIFPWNRNNKNSVRSSRYTNYTICIRLRRLPTGRPLLALLCILSPLEKGKICIRCFRLLVECIVQIQERGAPKYKNICSQSARNRRANQSTFCWRETFGFDMIVTKTTNPFSKKYTYYWTPKRTHCGDF